MVFDGDVLGANHLLRGHGKKRSRLHRSVVGDDHYQASVNSRQPRNHPRRRRTAPFLIHAVRGIFAQFEKAAWIR